MRRRYDDPLWEREDFDDQENKLIYHHDADTSKITGALYRKWLHFPHIQLIQAAGFASLIVNVLTFQHSDPSLILTHRQNLTTDNAL